MMAVDDTRREIIEVWSDVVCIECFIQKEAPEPCLCEKIDLVEDNFFFLAVDLPDLFFILWIEVDFFLKGERIPGGAKHAVCDFSASD